VDRGIHRVKSIVIVDNKRAYMFIDVAASYIHDSQLLPYLLSRLKTSHIAQIRAADAAFDSKKRKTPCARKNIVLLSATTPRRNRYIWKYQPLHRWIIERTFGWFSWFSWMKTMSRQALYLLYILFSSYSHHHYRAYVLNSLISS